MATQKVYCKYQEIIDLNTVGGTVSVIGIHTPTGDTPRKMFPGFFQQYKKWKYLGCSVVGANAAQLPVDPLGVSYEAGEGNDTVADPRDVLNPILFHGCHGQDLGPILNSLYSQNSPLTDSLTGFNEDNANDADFGRSDLVEGLYYKALTDATWKKFGIQSGIRLRRLHPLVYTMATNHYISPSDLGGEIAVDSNGNVVADGRVPDIDGLLAVGVRDTRFFTPRLTGLGWMETRLPYVAAANIPSQPSDDEYGDWKAQLQSVENYTTMPKIFMGVLLLPPSYRIKQFMRLVITHRFAFAGFRGASFADNILGSPSFFEAPDMDFSDGSNDDSILGGNPNDDSPGGDDSGGGSLSGVIDIEGVTLVSSLNTPNEKGGLYSKIIVDESQTLTASSSAFGFFVVSGNADGTESGRVYLVYKNGNNYWLNVDPNLGNGIAPSGGFVTLYPWTVSSWTSDTQIVTSGNAASLSIDSWGLSSDADGFGFDGSELFDRVKVLT